MGCENIGGGGISVPRDLSMLVGFDVESLDIIEEGVFEESVGGEVEGSNRVADVRIGEDG